MKKVIISTILVAATITTSAPVACSLSEIIPFLDKNAVLFNNCKIQVINNNKILLCSEKDFDLKPIIKPKPTTKTQIKSTNKNGQIPVKKTDVKQLFNSF